MNEAWKLLDLEFGDLEELRAKPKDQVRGLKIKATEDPAPIVKLFHQIQVIAAKIKATGNLAILENDDKYLALVSNHLSKEVMWEWFKQKTSGWSYFYHFLEDIAQTAKRQLTSKSIRYALSRHMGDKPKFLRVTSLTQECVTSPRMQLLSVK